MHHHLYAMLVHVSMNPTQRVHWILPVSVAAQVCKMQMHRIRYIQRFPRHTLGPATITMLLNQPPVISSLF